MSKPTVYKDSAQVEAAVRELLVESPLYQALRFEFRLDGPMWGWPKSLTYDCCLCEQPTTFSQFRADVANGDFYCLKFLCALCQKDSVTFVVYQELKGYTHTVRKIGQWPSWSIAVGAELERVLPAAALPFYKKALICLSQNFGLGAVAYFRRVVEEVVDVLLDLIEKAATVDPTNIDRGALDAVATARKSHQASERLKLAASVVPAHLRIGGANPLARLYEAYSEGVHTLTDHESIDVALKMRSVIDFLLPALGEQLRLAGEYRDALARAGRRRAAVAPATETPSVDG